jgi:MFS family permease
MSSMQIGSSDGLPPPYSVHSIELDSGLAVSNSPRGLVFGGLVAGLAVNRWGRSPVIAAGYLVSIAGVFVQVFASTPAEFFGGKILTGVPLGCFTTVAPTYASEMAPLPIRGAITAGMNFAIVLGQLIGYGVMRQASFYTGALTYKILFSTQWGFAVVGLAILPLFPE